ncbi:ROK family protein [Thermosipho atlanticus]|uniref:Glucokinase n=1 Tax=Thermosipho atlanticus DSM 15807 TaxID=1123380 RepID=A0A1M5U5B3_9BACT|nr:ROK family protein [Thermosipho atlanticus]SHH58051.1 glucokinase [Thermosipho atlanticus DSM 15807]
MKIIGVDLGGTFTKIGLVDSNTGKIIKKKEIETMVELGGDAVVKRISEGINELVGSETYEAVGIGSPGSIDIENGIVRFSPNFPDWIDFPLGPKLSNLLNKKVYVENDANSFALGEKWFGAGKGKKHIIVLTLGTGVGGGIISHDILITGANGIGAELGHVIINPKGRLCGCGNYGCLEAYASATAIIKMAYEGRKKFPDSIIFKNDKVTAKAVFDAAKSNDRLGLIIRDEVVEALAVAIASFIHTFNPEVVIIGGGISKAGEFLFKPLKSRVNELVMPSFKNSFEIIQSPLVENASILGAASIVLQRRKTT